MSKENNYSGEVSMREMQAAIAKAGGLFYQYRACRRNESTIYDIENIRHGVVYAQTPLNMNDPFDSLIGFSPERFYEDCLTSIVDAISIEDDMLKHIIIQLLKCKAIGKMAELLNNLNRLKKHLIQRRQIMHMGHVDMRAFVLQNSKTLYAKCPKDIKTYFTGHVFTAFSLLVSQINTTSISEADICTLLQMDDMLDRLYQEAIRIRDTTYIPQIRHFLEKLTVTCFSHSGWDNQLMWSHYANSYSGICIEYDFSQIKDFNGFIYPVEYSTTRPTLSLSDIGIHVVQSDGKPIIETNTDIDIKKLISYLLVKNTCWSYEDEWRIINVGEPNTPVFVSLPYIKSITFGLHVDDLCKALLWDVCREKKIECYQLLVNSENYSLSRQPLLDEDFLYDEDRENRYIELLANQFYDSGIKVENYCKPFIEKEEEKSTDWSKLPSALEAIIDMMSDAYFLKTSLNRFSTNAKDDFSSADEAKKSLEIIKGLDDFIRTAHENANTLLGTIPNLFLGGFLRTENYRKSSQLLHDIVELAEKYASISWDKKICPERLSALSDVLDIISE